jgi:hypothetical protein
MIPKQIFILGGGYSIKYLGTLDKGLFDWLKDKFTIGINYSYKFFDATVQLGNDGAMYEGIPPYDRETWAEIGKLPLFIGKSSKDIKHPHPNSIFFKHSKIWDRDLNNGVYRGTLSGISAISIAIKILDVLEKSNKTLPEIYLLGYDGGGIYLNDLPILDSKGIPLTHFYQEEYKHRGNGRISWYAQTHTNEITKEKISYADLEMLPFKNEKIVKIFNVNPVSNITVFPKISYDEMFNKTFETITNVDAVRNELREILQWIKQDKQI